jgi:hypothetical protein
MHVQGKDPEANTTIVALFCNRLLIDVQAANCILLRCAANCSTAHRYLKQVQGQTAKKKGRL